MITIIVAAAQNNSIGKKNQLIWHLSNDLKRFKKLTSGHHIIMGRKTFESFPKALPNRVNVIVTRDKKYRAKNAVVVHSIEDALDIAKDDTQPFIIGGGEIYKQSLNIADRIELTRVHHEFEGDTFFPEIDLNIWQETAKEFHKKDENHRYDYTYIRYKRASNKHVS
jgi:dihydrofolate reductase